MNHHLLRHIPLFAGLTDQDLDDLATYLQRQDFAPMHPVFWIGEPGEILYIIQKGQVHLSYPNEQGQEVTLARLDAGAFFGELSLLDGGSRTATARTQTETTLLSLNRETFYRFLEKHPQGYWPLIGTLVARLRRNTSKLRGIINVNEEAKVKVTRVQKLVDRIARQLASGTFLLATILFIAGWMGLHSYLYSRNHPNPVTWVDEPPTFFWLGLLVTLASFMLTILVLNSQRRQTEMDRLRGEVEYQVNLKAQAEVMVLQQKMDQVLERLARPEDSPGPDPKP